MKRALSNCRTAANERGVVALEFAVIAPVLLLLIIGTFDIARAVIVWQQTLTAANEVAVSAASLAVQLDGSTSLTPANVTLAESAFYAAMPQVQSGLYSGVYSVTLSGIVFTSNANNTTTATIIWSVPMSEAPAAQSHLQTVTRACGTVTQVNTQPLTSLTMTEIPTLPITQESTLVVADVHYQFTPLFFNFITGPIDFWESNAYPSPIGANNQPIYFDLANPADQYSCPGDTVTG